MPRSRAFCFTLNNYTPLEKALFEDHVQTGIDTGSITYAICGREIGESETPHLQAYIYYKNSNEVSMKTWEKRLGTTRYHIEVSRGTPLDNKKYCSKENNFQEWGECPIAQNDRWKDCVEMLQSGGSVKSLIVAHPQIGITCYRSLKEIRDEFMPDRSVNEKTELYWFYGNPGSGKSRYARAITSEYYQKPEGSWWTPDYCQQDVVLMDDWRPTKDFPLQELLRLADYGKHQVPVKGGFRKFKSKIVVITTPLSLSETFSQKHLEWIGTENLDQLKRRITFQCKFPLNALDAAILKTSLETSLMANVVSVGLEDTVN